MLTVERGREPYRWPAVSKAGLAGLGLAGLADVIAHLLGAAAGAHAHRYSAGEFAAHLGAFVSMVLVLLGVVVDGARQARARSRARTTRKGIA